MRKGFTVFSANKDVDLAVKAKAPAVDILTKERRLIEEFIGASEIMSCRAICQSGSNRDIS